MKRVMIDPPSGWMYGFPKERPSAPEVNMRSWLVENGYPEEDVDWAMNHCRMWEIPENGEKTETV